MGIYLELDGKDPENEYADFLVDFGDKASLLIEKYKLPHPDEYMMAIDEERRGDLWMACGILLSIPVNDPSPYWETIQELLIRDPTVDFILAWMKARQDISLYHATVNKIVETTNNVGFFTQLFLRPFGEDVLNVIARGFVRAIKASPRTDFYVPAIKKILAEANRRPNEGMLTDVKELLRFYVKNAELSNDDVIAIAMHRLKPYELRIIARNREAHSDLADALKDKHDSEYEEESKRDYNENGDQS